MIPHSVSPGEMEHGGHCVGRVPCKTISGFQLVRGQLSYVNFVHSR